MEISKFEKRLIECGIEIKLDDSAKEFLLSISHSDKYGARELKRNIQKYIQDEMSVKIITKEFKNGDCIKIVKSLTDENLEFINLSDMLSLNESTETSSENTIN